MSKILSRIIVHATNIHSGGGGALLTALLRGWPSGMSGVLQVDRRMGIESNSSAQLEINTIKPNIINRLKAEWWLRKKVDRGDLVLCFGNLPPLFRLRSKVVLFLQNRYLIEPVSLKGLSFKNKLRITVERLWIAWLIRNVQVVLVQTPTMERLLAMSGLLTQQAILICPFLSRSEGYFRSAQGAFDRRRCPHLVYVASGEEHKNHKRLIEAWCALADEGLFPMLSLTLDVNAFPELWKWIEDKKMRHCLQIDNHGVKSHEAILTIYNNSDALIYPSIFESLGIPLIEARQARLTILASELDYVRDVIDPEYTFDPLSAASIARAVKRYLGVLEKPLPLLDSRQFWELMISKIN